MTPEGVTSGWYIDVPVPGQTYVTPMSDVRRFLAEAGYASLIDETSSMAPVVRARPPPASSPPQHSALAHGEA